MGGHVAAAVAITLVYLPWARDRLVPVEDVIIESVLPVLPLVSQDNMNFPFPSFPGEETEVYVCLPQPVLGGFAADHALVTPPHRHGYWKN